MPKKPLTEYEKARAIWYKKLEKEGYVDIEADEYRLKEWTASRVKASQNSWESKEAYYQMATSFLNDYKFQSNVEKLIWEYHAEGISVVNIVKLLKNKTKVMIISRHTVWHTINRLENSMKRMYIPSQAAND